MVSDFQRRKVAAVFDALDVDRDGLLTESDFRALSRRWRATGTARHAALAQIIMRWWSTLLDESGECGGVGIDEVLALVERLPMMIENVYATAHAMFEAVDGASTGTISRSTYRTMIEMFSGRRTDTDQVFPLLDRNCDGQLSRAEFVMLWSQFWTGDDPTAPGTWVFGRFD